MEKVLEKVCMSLDGLADSLLDISPSDQTMTELYGWNCPPLNRHDISNLAKNISSDIKDINVTHMNSIDQGLIKSFELIPLRIEIFKVTTYPQLFNSNCSNAMTAYMALIDWIIQTLNPIYSLKIMSDNKALPKQLTTRLRSIQVELDNLIPEKVNLANQIKLIQDATDAAESLPTDLESLKEARSKIDKISTDAAELYGKIDTYYKSSGTISNIMISKKKEADLLVEQCEEAYRITTTKGLAAAFDVRAERLSTTMWIWVGGLITSLITGGIIGYYRFEALSDSLKNTNPQGIEVWMNIVLSLISLAAPIWLAWLATKQINQRFRLSEDYAFKASVAKAYEGYRREAARIDDAFEARLFSSALSRLEEAPLRLVETDSHGSPWHELFSSKAFQKALDTVPDLKDKFIEVAKDGIDVIKDKVKSNGITE
jgi:chaperonin cofactor prefoldin